MQPGNEMAGAEDLIRNGQGETQQRGLQEVVTFIQVKIAVVYPIPDLDGIQAFISPWATAEGNVHVRVCRQEWQMGGHQEQ